jgi:hypothetical protein
VFRLTRDPADDFTCQADLGGYEGADECQRLSLSVYRTLDRARYYRSIYTRYSGIARADLAAQHGKIKRTGRSAGHFSLWFRATYFGACSHLFRPVEL